MSEKEITQEQMQAIEEIGKLIAEDTRVVAMSIMVCDLMALIYMLGEWIQQHANDSQLVTPVTIDLFSTLVDIIQPLYPDYIDTIFVRGEMEEAISNFRQQNLEIKIEAKESKDNPNG